MNRKEFLVSCVGAATSVMYARPAFSQNAETIEQATLTVHDSSKGTPIPADFTGLSVETAILPNNAYFNNADQSLQGLIRRLGSGGVLRVGGNSSEYSNWNGMTTGHAQMYNIGPEDIDRLAAVADNVNWKVIYGLNLGTGSPQQAAAEAKAVHTRLGNRLLAFQIGNEPDLFAGNGLRPRTYTVNDYMNEWREFYEAVQRAVPGAPFAGPDIAFRTFWEMPFATTFPHDLRFLSLHYYAEGPGSSPKSTIEKMLAPNASLVSRTADLAAAAAAINVPYRMTECNSCYGGGRAGVSDTLAAALWGVDYMFQLAAAGYSGCNFHGGTGGPYSPLVEDGRGVMTYNARPLYYGMLMFALGGRGEMVPSILMQPNLNLNAYTATGPHRELQITVINKEPNTSVDIDITLDRRYNKGSVIRLTGSGIASKTGITLGGSTVSSSGDWQPSSTEPLAPHGRSITLHVPAASAALAILV